MSLEIKTATQWAEALATQAGNYARAVRNGSPHDPGEADSIVQSADRLRALAAAEYAEVQWAKRLGERLGALGATESADRGEG